MNKILVFFFFFGLLFFIPFGSFIFIMAPNSKLGKFMSLPCIKFFTSIISYFLFVVTILVSSIELYEDTAGDLEQFSVVYQNVFVNYTNYVQNTHIQYRFKPSDFFIRKHEPDYLDIAICIYLLGMVLRELKKLILFGIKEYVYAWSNMFACVLIVLFSCSFGLKFYSLIRVSIEKEKLSDPTFWQLIANLDNGTDTEQQSVFETFYWLNRDRFYWMSMDPMNLSEGLFAVSIVFCLARLCFWLPANQDLGPLQITLGQMLSDILKFICIFIIVFTGFMFGLNNLYWYYEPGVRNTVEINPHYNPYSFESEKTKAEERFGTIGYTFITMFFALYTLGESDDVLIEPFRNQLTTNFGYVLFGMFHISNITILLSMLIAMMTKSFDSILSHSDTEWKFSRSMLYMEFIKEGSVLPIPFNIIPTPASIFDIIKKVFFCCKTKPKPNLNPEQPSYYAAAARPNNKNNKNKAQPSGHSYGSFELNYKIVMERVAKRFLLHNSREREEVKESDFDELKQDMQMVRYELVNDVNTFAKNLVNYTALLHRGISILGEYFFQKDSNSETSGRFKLFQSHTNNFQLLDDVSLNYGGSGESANKSIKMSTRSSNESARIDEY